MNSSRVLSKIGLSLGIIGLGGLIVTSLQSGTLIGECTLMMLVGLTIFIFAGNE